MIAAASSEGTSSTSLLSLVLSKLIELYVGSESSAELKDSVEGKHRRRIWLIVQPSRKQSVADCIAVVENL